MHQTAVEWDLVLSLRSASVVSTATLELAVVEKIEPRAWCVTAMC